MWPEQNQALPRISWGPGPSLALCFWSVLCPSCPAFPKTPKKDPLIPGLASPQASHGNEPNRSTLCLLVHPLPISDPHKLPLVALFQGFRSLEDIRNLASLTAQQAIGLKHYSDFLERMPRDEAAEIEQTVSKGPRAVGRSRPSE